MRKLKKRVKKIITTKQKAIVYKSLIFLFPNNLTFKLKYSYHQYLLGNIEEVRKTNEIMRSLVHNENTKPLISDKKHIQELQFLLNKRLYLLDNDFFEDKHILTNVIGDKGCVVGYYTIAQSDKNINFLGKIKNSKHLDGENIIKLVINNNLIVNQTYNQSNKKYTYFSFQVEKFNLRSVEIIISDDYRLFFKNKNIFYKFCKLNNLQDGWDGELGIIDFFCITKNEYICLKKRKIIFDPMILDKDLIVLGSFYIKKQFNGLKISGKTFKSIDKEYVDLNRKKIFIKLDNNIIRIEKLIKNRKKNYFVFSFTIKRNSLYHFSENFNITVDHAGKNSFYFKSKYLSAKVNNKLRNNLQYARNKNIFLDKKGRSIVSSTVIKTKQDKYLKLYSLANEMFVENFNRPLFLLYGTLLGLYRDNDFIQGDDDFDIGYVSDYRNPALVKKETIEIMLKMIERGFTISINRRGKPFRIHHNSIGNDIHLDARPVWYQNGKVWANKQACLNTTLDSFNKTIKKKFHGIEVNIPKGTEEFLELYYGKKWRVPDPSFTNSSLIIPKKIVKNLKKSCFTKNELAIIQKNVENLGFQEKGEFLPIGLLDLYPTENYEKKCNW